MTRVATAANESVLVSIGRYGTATHVENLVKKYRWTQRRDAAALAHAEQLNRQVHSFYDDTDTFVLHARLPPEVGALVRKALEIAGNIVREHSEEDARARIQASMVARSQAEIAAGTWAINDKERSHAARHADALRLIVETFLATTSEEVEATSSADRYQVVVHVDQAVLTEPVAASGHQPHRCELDDGPALALDTVRRLGCDGTLVGIVEGADGEPLNVGRKTRSIPLALQRALRARDGGCRFPGVRPYALHGRPPCQALGQWRRDEALQPHLALRLSPHARARGRLPSRNDRRRRLRVHAAGRPAHSGVRP